MASKKVRAAQETKPAANVTTATAQTDLHTRAVLVSLRISSWSARKFDKRVTREATTAQGADESAGRFNKHLLPSTVSIDHSAKSAQAQSAVTQTNSFRALIQHIAATRQWHYDQTLRWSDDGWQLLPIKNHQAYTDGMRQRQHTFDSLLADFVRDYPRLREAAKALLNGMFVDADYPSDIRRRFSFGIEFSPVPQGGDFRVALGEAEIAAIAASTEARVKSAFEDAQGDAVKRLYTTVEKIVERLSQPDAIFRDTLITNARDLCEVLGRLNVAGDATLERLRRETELLTMSEPETLRKVDAVRVETATRAQSILDEMIGTYGKGLLG
jgi:hypothetical protein